MGSKFPKTIAIFLSIGIFFWIFDSVVDYLFFYEGLLSDLMIFDVPAHELYVRSSFLIFMLILGILSSKMICEHDKTLQESELRFRKAVEEFPFSIVLMNQNVDPVFFNKKFTETFGYSPEDISTMEKWWELAYPDEKYREKARSAWINAEKEMMNEGKVCQAEWKVTCKDGSVKDIEFHFTRTSDEQFMLIFSDVTSKKEAETALLLDDLRLEALLKLNQMMDSTVHEITLFTLEEAVKLTQSKVGYLGFLNKDESLITINSWSRISMEMCGIDSLPLEYRVADVGIWGEPIRQRKPVIINDFKADNIQKKGYPEGHVEIRNHLGVPIFENDKIVVLAGVGNKEKDYDSSDVRQMTLLMNGMWNIIKKKKDADRFRQYTEELAKKNEELESLDVMKNEFLSNLTHELMTPLISIKGYGELLFEGQLGPLNENQNKSVENIVQSSERLHKRINSLLCMQNVQSDNIQYDLDVIHISDLLEKVLYEASLSQDEELPMIKKEVPISLPLVLGNLIYLEIVFSHLLENAVKFTPVTGSITVFAYSDNDSLHVIFQDTGIGIPEGRIPDIFKLFYQVDGSLARKYGGNGVGLYLCKSIVEGHGGTIELKSVPGEGTQVEVILPVMKITNLP
ncbi:GAF domain-containing protein [Methanolobus sp. ZRKC2]|uniref:sensor histidine kinase n=1 Tax=Methanolobus sp. ZRKC2 TaxID=3125783 RepID=UPI0032567C61